MLRLFVSFLFCAILLPGAHGEGAAQWRLFKVGEGYAASVTVGPRGTVWARHGESAEITILDGYKSHHLAAPDVGNYRVYEGRAGQLWSVYAEGLFLFERGQWVRHPVNEIRAEIQANTLNPLRQISLIPAEISHVYFLLSDRLMEYDATTRRAALVRLASETGLEKFTEMQESRDGGAWVAGVGGVAKLPSPLRHLTSASVWSEFLLDPSSRIRNLQRPTEDAAGAITMTGWESGGENQRAVVSFNGTEWVFRPVPGEKLRQAWKAWDETLWAYTYNSLFRLDQFGKAQREGVLGAQYDVASEASGVFWLATSEGLVRYAPLLWRSPPELRQLESPIHAMLPDTDQDPNHFWFASIDGLIELRNEEMHFIKWPESAEPFFHSTDALYRLASQRLAISAAGRLFIFDPVTSSFHELKHPRGERVRILGQFKDGTLCARVFGRANGVATLEIFNGEDFSPFEEIRVDAGLGSEFHFMAMAENGDVWIGGVGAVGVLRRGEKKLEVFGPGQGFTAERALTFLELGEGRFWCGSADKIFEFNGRRWESLRGGFDRISSLSRGKDGKIWVATNSGVYRYLNGSWLMNDVNDGLPSGAVHKVIVDTRGRIWAGTSRGPTIFHPDADTDPPRTLAPVLDNPVTPATDRLTSIAFSGVDKWGYTPSSELLYSYHLDENPWSQYNRINTKAFENLSAGNHRFEVKAMDRNGNEDPFPAHLDFVVIVPFYKDPRLLAVTICGFILIVLLAGLAVNRHLQLLRSYAEVEKIVAQRTQELEKANQELLHSQKMRALGTLAAGIAHDFNNILSVIKGSAQIIENNTGDKEKIQTRVERIKMVVEQGAGIVRSMLGLGRITEKELTRCSPSEVVDETIKLVSDRLPAEVIIQHEKTAPLPEILCSRELIQQMLLNLILNSLDAVGGKGRITLRTALPNELPAHLVLAPAGALKHISISVEDNGAGITPEVLPRIFEPFYTTKAFSTRRGTGLGLSMVYELAKSVRYGIAVESKPGAGSQFTIFIPTSSGENKIS